MKKSSLSKLFSTTLAILSFGAAIGIPQPSNSQVGFPQPSSSQTTAFNSAEVDQSKFVVAATYSQISNLYQLVIIEQISPTRSCWSESSRNPTTLDLLLLQFNFTGICGRATDSNGYSIRMGGQDLGVSYSFTFVRSGNDLVMVGSDPFNQNSPKIEIGRTNGLSQSPMKINLSPGWRLTRRTFEGNPLGHIYLTNNRTLSQVIAAGGVFTGTIAETGDGLGTGRVIGGNSPGTTGGGATGTGTTTGGGNPVCITPTTGTPASGTTATGTTSGVTTGSNSSGTTSGGTTGSRTTGTGTTGVGSNGSAITVGGTGTTSGTGVNSGTGTTGSGISGNRTTGSGVTSGSNPSGTPVTSGTPITTGVPITSGTATTSGGTTASRTTNSGTTGSGVTSGSNSSGIPVGGAGTTGGTGTTGSGTTGAGTAVSSGANVCVTPGSGTTGGGWNNR